MRIGCLADNAAEWGTYHLLHRPFPLLRAEEKQAYGNDNGTKDVSILRSS